MRKAFILLMAAIALSITLSAQLHTKTYIAGKYYDSLKEFGYVTYNGMRMTQVGKDSFQVSRDCNKDDSVVIPEELKVNKRTFKITSLAEGAFQDRPHIYSVTLPPTITEIASCAFRSCYGLEECRMPGVKAIYSSAFFRAGFRSLVLPEGLEYIGYMAFCECRKLKYLELPSTVTHIGKMAFQCESLDTVKVNFSQPIEIPCGAFWIRPDFSNQHRIALKVPKGSAEAFRNDEVWKLFRPIIEY